ncbi:MAG: hypothetical protein IJV97_02370 [Alphaproteobacteria bacterium]|nr:hypothetical protein [Alphaproteobacteria bacterium]
MIRSDLTPPNYLNEYHTTMKSLNEYERSRNQDSLLSSNISTAEKSKMVNMVADLRHKDGDFLKKYAQNFNNDIQKGNQPKLPTYNNQQVSTSDMSFALAESLQYLYSGESPLSEYYDWVQDQRKIEVDINTNGTTEEEIFNRNNFISFLDDRETELKLVISLYSTAERSSSGPFKEITQQRLNFLNFKLNELRRLRERTQQTKNHSDEKEQNLKEGIVKTANLINDHVTDSYLQNQIIAQELETAVEKVHPNYMPETKNINDIYEKKLRLYNNNISMSRKINELRGINTVPVSYSVKPKTISRPRGFSMYEYQRVAKEYS